MYYVPHNLKECSFLLASHLIPCTSPFELETMIWNVVHMDAIMVNWSYLSYECLIKWWTLLRLSDFYVQGYALVCVPFDVYSTCVILISCGTHWGTWSLHCTAQCNNPSVLCWRKYPSIFLWKWGGLYYRVQTILIMTNSQTTLQNNMVHNDQSKMPLCYCDP